MNDIVYFSGQSHILSTIVDKFFAVICTLTMKEVCAMTEYNEKAVAAVIRRLRKEKGLTQEVLSGFAGLGRSHLAMIESGTKKANFETLWKIANALEIKPHELVRQIEAETEKHL